MNKLKLIALFGLMLAIDANAQTWTADKEKDIQTNYSAVVGVITNKSYYCKYI